MPRTELFLLTISSPQISPDSLYHLYLLYKVTSSLKHLQEHPKAQALHVKAFLQLIHVEITSLFAFLTTPLNPSPSCYKKWAPLKLSATSSSHSSGRITAVQQPNCKFMQFIPKPCDWFLCNFPRKQLEGPA